MFIRVFISVLIVFFSATSSFSETENYCHDEEAVEEWEVLAKKSPNDLELQRLHALRLGICEKIEAGSLMVGQGIELFEKERQAVVNKRFEENREKKKSLVQ